MKKRYQFQSISHVFWNKIDDISSSSGSILMQDSVLETLLVVDYTIKISAQNLMNFIVKFGTKVEICWKMKDLKWIFLNNSEVSRNLLGHILLFWKNTMQAFQKTPNFQWIFPLKKNWWRVVVYERCRGDLGHAHFYFHLFWWN